MTAIPSTVGITGTLAPKNVEDTHGTHEDTYGKGGFRVVADQTAREAIPADRRKEGMWVYQLSDASTWKLSGGITNGDWVEVTLGGGVATPEFILASPRTIADDDHDKAMVSLVAAGLTVDMPSTVTPGTRFFIGSTGYDVTLLPGSGGRFVGPVPLYDAAGLRLSDNGAMLEIVFLGTPAGTPLWGLANMQGVVYVTDGGGTLTGARYTYDGGIGREDVNEVITTNRTVGPNDNRMMFETYQSGSGVGPLTAEIDQALFSLNTDEGWTATFRVGHNDDGDPVPLYVACTTSEMSVDAATFIQSLYCDEHGAFLIVRYAYAGSDRGRFTVVGGRGTWTDDLAGVHTFSGGAAYATQLAATGIDLIDDTDFVLEELAPNVTEGVGYTVEVTPTTAVGSLTVELYQDAARSEVVYTMIVDLTDAATYRAAEAFGFDLETAGTLYATAFVSGVGGSETFDITLSAVALQPTTTPVPLPSPYGQGIEDDGTGKPRIDLASDGGLAFDGSDNLVIDPDLTAPVHPTLSAAGVAITGAINDSEDQVVAVKVMFDALGCTPLGDPGAPVAGTYETGQEILDSNLARWRCTSGGTPGDWVLIETVADDMVDASDTCLAGESVLIPIPTTGNVGIVQTLQIWALVDDVPGDYAVEFRARIYADATLEGRDVLWQGTGYVGQSYLTASLPAAQGYMEVNDVDVFITDDPVVIIEDANRYELGRLSSRDTGAGTITLAEALEDASSWDADTAVCGVAEFFNLAFRNTDAAPENQNQVILELRNNSIANDVTFFVRAYPISLGVMP